MSKTKLTSWESIWSLAWPHSLMNMLFTLLMLVDIYWVGKWGGDDPINAIAICGPILWTIQSSAMFIFHGMQSLVSRCVGAGDSENAVLISRQGIMVGLIMGIVITAAMVMLADPLLRLYYTTEKIHTMAYYFLVIMMSTIPIYYFFMSIYAVFSSHNNTKEPMFMTLVAWVGNVVLDPVLIFGAGPIPALGIIGAAVATSISYVIAISAFFLFFRKTVKNYIPVKSIKDFKPRWSIIKEIIRIGTPASINGISRPLSATILMGVLTLLGREVVAAFGIAVRIISVNWIYLGGLNVAVSSLVGQNLGARSVPGAENAVLKTWRAGMIIQVAFSGIMILFSTGIASVFTSSPVTISETSYFLSVLALCTVTDVFIAVYGGALNGAGDTSRAMVSSILANWIYKLPLSYGAYYLLGADPAYIYWIVALSLPLEGLANYYWYKKGAWKVREFNIG